MACGAYTSTCAVQQNAQPARHAHCGRNGDRSPRPSISVSELRQTSPMRSAFERSPRISVAAEYSLWKHSDIVLRRNGSLWMVSLRWSTCRWKRCESVKVVSLFATCRAETIELRPVARSRTDRVAASQPRAESPLAAAMIVPAIRSSTKPRLFGVIALPLDRSFCDNNRLDDARFASLCGNSNSEYLECGSKLSTSWCTSWFAS